MTRDSWGRRRRRFARRHGARWQATDNAGVPIPSRLRHRAGAGFTRAPPAT